MTILLADPDIASIPVCDNGEPLVEAASLGIAYVGSTEAGRLVRQSLARRLERAQAMLPAGVSLCVYEGFRSAGDQLAIIERYSVELRRDRPDLDEQSLLRLTSRYVAPLAVAPHVAGAAVDVTLRDGSGRELWMGTRVDATPEQSDNAVEFAAASIDHEARANRDLLAHVLESQGLVNYPTEWWHWSYGDRYWAHTTGAGAALYGPVRSGGVE